MSGPQVPLGALFIAVTEGVCRISMQGMDPRLRQNRGQVNSEEGMIKLEKAFLTKANLEHYVGLFFSVRKQGLCRNNQCGVSDCPVSSSISWTLGPTKPSQET